MNQELLKLIPKRYLCPYCGEWHDWRDWGGEEHELEYYDSEQYEAELDCPNLPYGGISGDYRFYFEDGYCHYYTRHLCGKADQFLQGKIPISSIIESTDKPIVTFEVNFTSRGFVGTSECSGCDFKDKCICVKLGDKGNGYDMKITFGFEFDQSDYNKFVKTAIPTCNEKNSQASKKPQVKENKEDTTMTKNNIFNMNMEFGPNKDENIASTLMGVAVKNGDSWRIYDKKKKEITDVGDMQLGNLPIFILPATQISEGDLIKDDGEYYFVTKVATTKTPTQTLSVRTGEIKSVVPIKNILGFSCYSKVIALSDSLDMGDDFDVEKLAIMSAMCGQTGDNGGQMNQLLPLMLFKDKFGGEDDTMKLLLMSSMMTSAENGNQMNQLLPFMLFKDKFGGENDTMKLLLMSSMMGDNMAGYNNPLVGYLMLDTFMSKKDADETAE